MLKGLLVGVVTLYKTFLSPLLPPACRFYPSCSSYAIQALEKHGVINGLWLALRRLIRCHPYNPGGTDPIP